MRRLKLLLIPLFALALAACASNPVSTAQTIEQKAAAVYGQFVIAEEAARDIVCPNYREKPLPCKPTAPIGVVRAIASADRVAKPLADTLAVVTRNYGAVKNANGTAAQLAAALNALNYAYTDALPSIKALIAAVSAHKESI